MPRVIGSWLNDCGIFRRLGCSVGRGIVAGILFDCLTVYLSAGMPTGSHKKRGTTFCGKLDGELPLPVRSVKDPPYCQKIISSDLNESQESIFWCQKSGFTPFGGRLASLPFGICNGLSVDQVFFLI